MKQGKYAAPVRRRRRRNTLKPMLIAMAVVLLLGCVTGGTLAWLTATTTPVTNTFTVGDINIELAESANLDLKMIPGHTITKDPKVTVLKDSEDCLLLVKVTKSANFDAFMSYTPADGWTKLDSKSTALVDVYYREVTSITSNAAFDVLANNKVSVKDSVTKTMMNALTDDTRPTLTFEAAAVQLSKDGTSTNKFSADDAYEAVWPTSSTTP